MDAAEGQMVKPDMCWHLVREQRLSVLCRSVCHMERDGALRTDTHKHLDNGSERERREAPFTHAEVSVRPSWAFILLDALY